MSKRLFEYSMSDFWLFDSGFIECRDCGDYWCEHVKLLISANGDMGTIWPEEGVQPFSEQSVMVPMIPTSSMWAHCHLEYAFKVKAYKVYLMEGQQHFNNHFLGFISEGEARMTLRSMVTDWFRGNVNTSLLECQQSNHSFEAEMRWQRDMRDYKTSFGQYWSVWTREKCLGCSGTSDDFDDLVPDEDKQPTPWSKP